MSEQKATWLAILFFFIGFVLGCWLGFKAGYIQGYIHQPTQINR